MKLSFLQSAACLSLITLFACSSDKEHSKESETYPVCERLFGAPNKNTGLEKGQCSPVCASCEGSEEFEPAQYSAAELEQMRALTLSNAPALLGENPYARADEHLERADHVCGMKFDGSSSYQLTTYETSAEAQAAGAQITHQGACGACSSLQDLAVYIEIPDLTDPVRRCGVENLTGNVQTLAECIGQLGFTEACSEIWAYNSINTREQCFDVCIEAFDQPYHLADGAPNACIQCDEDNSGPVFKAVSGRTRRNSGLPTALCRPCEGVAQIQHHYF